MCVPAAFVPEEWKGHDYTLDSTATCDSLKHTEICSILKERKKYDYDR